MEPKFERGISEGELLLLCPRCGGTYLHHTNVNVFERPSEDASAGLHVRIEGMSAQVDTSMAGNPSRRRDGLTVEFYCEACQHHPTLRIFQSKGQTFIGFASRPTGESK